MSDEEMMRKIREMLEMEDSPTSSVLSEVMEFITFHQKYRRLSDEIIYRHFGDKAVENLVLKTLGLR